MTTHNPTETPKNNAYYISPNLDATISIRLPNWSKELICKFSEEKKQTITKTIIDALDNYKPIAKLHSQKVDEVYQMIINSSDRLES